MWHCSVQCVLNEVRGDEEVAQPRDNLHHRKEVKQLPVKAKREITLSLLTTNGDGWNEVI